MALQGLRPVLDMLYQRSQFTLCVHPDEQAEALEQVRKSFMLGLVRVVPSVGMARGDAYLLSSAETWQFKTIDDEERAKIGA